LSAEATASRENRIAEIIVFIVNISVGNFRD